MQKIIEHLVKFRNARGWKNYHTPANLAQALAVEAAELQELYLWDTWKGQPTRERVAEELADVLIYALYMIHAYDFSIDDIIKDKIAKNAVKYPITK